MKRIVSTVKAPAAIGPYSQAVIYSGKIMFCSGQIGLDKETGKLVEGIEAQVEKAMENIGAVLEAAKSGFGSVLKTTIFLTDMADFQVVNLIYARFFQDTKPARSTVQVANLPLNALVEIECIASVPD